MQDEHEHADPRTRGDGGHDDGPAIDIEEIWRRYRVPILLVGLLTLGIFVLFLIVVAGLGIHAADYLARH